MPPRDPRDPDFLKFSQVIIGLTFPYTSQEFMFSQSGVAINRSGQRVAYGDALGSIYSFFSLFIQECIDVGYPWGLRAEHFFGVA
jgi:hypothetical protein